MDPITIIKGIHTATQIVTAGKALYSEAAGFAEKINWKRSAAAPEEGASIAIGTNMADLEGGLGTAAELIENLTKQLECLGSELLAAREEISELNQSNMRLEHQAKAADESIADLNMKISALNEKSNVQQTQIKVISILGLVAIGGAVAIRLFF